MRSLKGMKLIGVVAVIGIVSLGLTTLCQAQQAPVSGVTLGVQPSQGKGDLSHNTQGPKGTVKQAPVSGAILGVQPSQGKGDLAHNTQGTPGSVKQAPVSGVILGVQPSQGKGDLSKNSDVQK